MQFCGLQHLINDDEAITLPENDSQTNSGLSQKALQSFIAQHTDKENNQKDDILRKCGFTACEELPLGSEGFRKALDL